MSQKEEEGKNHHVYNRGEKQKGEDAGCVVSKPDRTREKEKERKNTRKFQANPRVSVLKEKKGHRRRVILNFAGDWEKGKGKRSALTTSKARAPFK